MQPWQGCRFTGESRILCSAPLSFFCYLHPAASARPFPSLCRHSPIHYSPHWSSSWPNTFTTSGTLRSLAPLPGMFPQALRIQLPPPLPVCLLSSKWPNMTTFTRADLWFHSWMLQLATLWCFIFGCLFVLAYALYQNVSLRRENLFPSCSLTLFSVH